VGRYASIDYGLAKIGLALSDERKIIASPLQVLSVKKTTNETIENILTILSPFEIEKIVVGLPFLLNGKKGLMADEVEHFLTLLKAKTHCPIVTMDERLTTLQAEKALKEFHLNRKRRSKVIDSVAATLLLQNYLDLVCHLDNQVQI
jgi:putative holliday junction resolvase